MAEAFPALGDNDVVVVRGSLRTDVENLKRSGRVLSADELRRAKRYFHIADQERFIVGRAMLRHLLAHYLGATPAALAFSYGPHGKPALRRAAGLGDISFNVSHTGDVVLYALARGRRVGVDVEGVRDDASTLDIARRFFAPTEVQMLLALPIAERNAAFFRLWTCKEAYVKARGDGLSSSLARFVVEHDATSGGLRLAIPGDPAASKRWVLTDIRVADGYAAALAAEGQDMALTCVDLPRFGSDWVMRDAS